ncbi:MAG: hypothetical protein ACI86H_002458 [bacterium]
MNTRFNFQLALTTALQFYEFCGDLTLLLDIWGVDYHDDVEGVEKAVFICEDEFLSITAFRQFENQAIYTLPLILSISINGNAPNNWDHDYIANTYIPELSQKISSTFSVKVHVLTIQEHGQHYLSSEQSIFNP